MCYIKTFMNILFLNSIRPAVWGGGEKWMVETALGLNRRGHRCIVAGRVGSVWLEHARTCGLETRPLSIRSDIDPVIVTRLYRLMRFQRIDLVCPNFDKDLRLGGVAARLAGVPAVVVRKGLPLMKGAIRFRLTYRYLADAIVTPSADIKARFAGYPWLPPITVIHNGVDLKRYRHDRDPQPMRRSLSVPEETTLIGTVGRLVDQKGYPDLLEALHRIVRHGHKITALLVGEGPKRPEIETIIQKTGLSSVCRLLGHRDDTPDIFASLDLFILPSLDEGLPNAVLEAMACGKPVIATTVGGTPEAVLDRETGLLVPPRCPERLATAIETLLRDPVLSRTMGEKGRKRTEEMFTVEKMLDGVEHLFLSTIETRKKGAQK
jgi:glycosyltransferase involved in cell wall biosynthesis